ncbi:MAG: hypothetical protein WDN04_07895 [Rhodospirillales bacterium]
MPPSVTVPPPVTAAPKISSEPLPVLKCPLPLTAPRKRQRALRHRNRSGIADGGLQVADAVAAQRLGDGAGVDDAIAGLGIGFSGAEDQRATARLCNDAVSEAL